MIVHRPDLLDTVTTRLYSLREQRNLSKPNVNKMAFQLYHLFSFLW